VENRSHVRWFNGGKPTFREPSLPSSSGTPTTPKYVQRQISEVVSSLTTRTLAVLEALVYLPFNHLMQLLVENILLQFHIFVKK